MARWGSFNGKSRNISDLDQQHMSNILWYHELLFGVTEGRRVDVIIEELGIRFGGKRLPYQPVDTFKMEIDMLRRKGYIKDNGLNEDVVVDGVKVGEVIKGTNPGNGFKFV